MAKFNLLKKINKQITPLLDILILIKKSAKLLNSVNSKYLVLINMYLNQVVNTYLQQEFVHNL
jgi:hypothetical protein